MEKQEIISKLGLVNETWKEVGSGRVVGLKAKVFKRDRTTQQVTCDEIEQGFLSKMEFAELVSRKRGQPAYYGKITIKDLPIWALVPDELMEGFSSGRREYKVLGRVNKDWPEFRLN